MISTSGTIIQYLKKSKDIQKYIKEPMKRDFIYILKHIKTYNDIYKNPCK